MQTARLLVLKDGTVCFNNGDIRLSQDRRIWIINKRPDADAVIGHFSAKLPDKFDLWGGDAESRKAVAEILKTGKEIKRFGGA